MFIDVQNNYFRDSIILTIVFFFMAVGSQSAWCLMGNHYHILVETIEGNLSKGMRHLEGWGQVLHYSIFRLK